MSIGALFVVAPPPGNRGDFALAHVEPAAEEEDGHKGDHHQAQDREADAERLSQRAGGGPC